MGGELLLDTGALVTLLDRSQRHHSVFKAFFEEWEAPVISTEAVLTEATHLLGRVAGGRRTSLDFFLAGAVLLVPATLISLRRCRSLMERYADLPMDFADATLVTLAEDAGASHVFTTDRKGFAVYRIGKRGRFTVFPDFV